MAQEFLKAAEQVLRQHQKPLLVKDILQKALEDRLLMTGGSTPTNTMRARLSEHIRKNKEHSTFIRVGPNEFALREWNIDEYKSQPFEKTKQQEIAVCIKQRLVDKRTRLFGFSPNFKPYLNDLKDLSNVVLCHRDEAKTRLDLKQLVSYVVLKNRENQVLSFVRGTFGQKESLLQGVLCIGFGGHVNVTDIDLFGVEDAGIKNSAFREIYEEIKGLNISDLKYIGVINDDSSPLGLNHFAFVLEGKLPAKFNEKTFSREMSINKIRFLTPKELWERFHELEFWSQLLVKNLFAKPKHHNPVFVKTKGRRLNDEPILVVGEIGSGKTEVSSHLSFKYDLPLVSTRKCVAKIIGIKNFGTKNRNRFQEKAAKLISTKSGVTRLAKEIIEQIKKTKKTCVIIDGVRNLATYNILKATYPKMNLVYIDVPRDTAYILNRNRSGGRKVSIHEFRESRHHDVEKEISLFKTRADVYLFNGGNLNDLYKTINNWWDEGNKV